MLAAHLALVAIGRAMFHADTHHQPFFDPILAGEQFTERRPPILREDFGQKAQSTHLDAQHWHVVGRAQPSGAQHGAVSAQGDQQIGGGQVLANGAGIPGRAAPGVFHAVLVEIVFDLGGQFERLRLFGMVEYADILERWLERGSRLCCIVRRLRKGLIDHAVFPG
ncbi:MAG: hypothetical protein R2856_34320 [Caldilineaceae bacterium]